MVVGRITLDSESTSGPVKLNEASLVLESSRMMGSGARVPIRFDPEVRLRKGKRGVGGQGLFPGAIVALKGKNGGGGSFLASEILSVSSFDTSITSQYIYRYQATSARVPIGCSRKVRGRISVLHVRCEWAIHWRLRPPLPAPSESCGETQVR